MEYIDVGLRIAYRQRGEGPNLLLLHGALSDGRVWRTQLETLSDQFTVIAWDAPGCGGSADPPDDFRLPDFALCLGRLIDALQLGRAHVLGHSWGSAVALELARQRPSIVTSLVLVGGYAGWAGSLSAEETQRRLQFALEIADSMQGSFDPETMFGLFSDAMPPERADELREIMRDIRPAGTRTMAMALAEADLRPVLPQIEVPTLLVHGDADQRSSLDVARALQAGIAGSELSVLPGLGHECYLESPHAFDSAVRTFLLDRGTAA